MGKPFDVSKFRKEITKSIEGPVWDSMILRIGSVQVTLHSTI